MTKVHLEVSHYRRDNIECILIGHKGHPEVEGTLGQAKDGMYLVEDLADVERLKVTDENKLAYVTQTTLSVDDTANVIDALRKRFPDIRGPRKDDICYATQNRQDAVKLLAEQCDVLLVVGSANSSNSNRLRELAQNNNIPAYLIDSFEQIEDAWLENKQAVGITAGASAPEILVQQVVEELKRRGASVTKEIQCRPESISFSLPVALREPERIH